MRTVLLLLVITGLAAAQTRDFFPWWDTPIARNLNLSEDQHRQIHSTVREYRDKLVDLRANLEKSENALSDLMNDDHPDLQKANPVIERAVQARAELTRTFAQMGIRLRAVLTPQQWKQLQRNRPMPGVPGAPGIPGRPMQNQSMPMRGPNQGPPPPPPPPEQDGAINEQP